jgi:hypothetical protein
VWNKSEILCDRFGPDLRGSMLDMSNPVDMRVRVVLALALGIKRYNRPIEQRFEDLNRRGLYPIGSWKLNKSGTCVHAVSGWKTSVPLHSQGGWKPKQLCIFVSIFQSFMLIYPSDTLWSESSE